LLVPAAMVIGNAPDQRRAAPDAQSTSTTYPLDSDAIAYSSKPSVTIAASAISINVGDKIIGTIVGPDSNGNRHFIAAQGIFSVDPQSALEGLNSATLVVTRTNRGIEAILAPDISITQPQTSPVKLQLIEANINQLTQTLKIGDLVAADTPITLATEIGQALRSIGHVLPQGFSFTPKYIPLQPAMVPLITTDTPKILPELVDVSSPGTQALSTPIAGAAATDVLALATPPTTAFGVGSTIKVERPATEGIIDAQNTLSLLADLPDTPSNRTMFLQSPLFANLLKSGRLIIVASPAIVSAQAQIVSMSDMAQLTTRNQTTAPIALLDLNDAPLPLQANRLFLLFDTAPSKALLLTTDQSIAASIPLTTDDIDILRLVQHWQVERAVLPQIAAPILPALKPDLPADILLLFNAFGRKITSPHLQKIAEARYVGVEPTASNQTALENIAQLIRRNASPTSLTDSQQRLVLPIQMDGQLTPLVFVFSPPQDQPFKDTGQHEDIPWPEKEQIFALSIEFDQLGPLILRGRCDAKSLNLAIETRTPLPETLQASTQALFLETLEAAAMVGYLHFGLTSERGWQTQSPTL
jgi:hypothetical protein